MQCKERRYCRGGACGLSPVTNRSCAEAVKQRGRAAPRARAAAGAGRAAQGGGGILLGHVCIKAGRWRIRAPGFAGKGDAVAQRIAIMTDTNSGIEPDEARALGIDVVPMPFVVGGEECFEGVNLNPAEFYERLAAGADIATSQPSIVDLGKRWFDALESCDAVVYIPMSSGLSGSCATAQGIANRFGGKVHVVDNQRISVTQREAVLDALRWADAGLNAAQIAVRLEQTALSASIYIMVDTLEHLKRGGRITPAVAAIGSMLKIKPVLQIQGEKLDAFSVAKSLKSAERTMLKALEKDVSERFGGAQKVHLYVAHANRAADAEALAATMRERFGTDDVHVARLPLSIACHTGAGALGVGCAKREK